MTTRARPPMASDGRCAATSMWASGLCNTTRSPVGSDVGALSSHDRRPDALPDDRFDDRPDVRGGCAPEPIPATRLPNAARPIGPAAVEWTAPSTSVRGTVTAAITVWPRAIAVGATVVSVAGMWRPIRPRTDSIVGAGRRLMRPFATVVVGAFAAAPGPDARWAAMNGARACGRSFAAGCVSSVRTPSSPLRRASPSARLPKRGGATRSYA